MCCSLIPVTSQEFFSLLIFVNQLIEIFTLLVASECKPLLNADGQSRHTKIFCAKLHNIIVLSKKIKSFHLRYTQNRHSAFFCLLQIPLTWASPKTGGGSIQPPPPYPFPGNSIPFKFASFTALVDCPCQNQMRDSPDQNV